MIKTQQAIEIQISLTKTICSLKLLHLETVSQFKLISISVLYLPQILSVHLEPETVVFHCHSAQKQLWMVTAFLLTSTHHIQTHHHAMRAWNNDNHLVFFQIKSAYEFNMGNVMLFTYLFTCLTSPWHCHKIKCTLWPWLFNRKSNSLFSGSSH